VKILTEIGLIIVGFSFGLVVASGFFTGEKTIWLRWVAGGLMPAGIALAEAGRRGLKKERASVKRED